jgi:hypothetical protein
MDMGAHEKSILVCNHSKTWHVHKELLLRDLQEHPNKCSIQLLLLWLPGRESVWDGYFCCVLLQQQLQRYPD